MSEPVLTQFEKNQRSIVERWNVLRLRTEELRNTLNKAETEELNAAIEVEKALILKNDVTTGPICFWINGGLISITKDADGRRIHLTWVVSPQ